MKGWHGQGYDILEDMYGAKTAAMNFVHEICKTRAKGILEGFMGTIISVLSTHQVSLHCPARSESGPRKLWQDWEVLWG